MKSTLPKSWRYTIMSGQTLNFEGYYKALKSMPEPIPVTRLPRIKLDMNGARQYASNKGVTVNDLTTDEKKMFMNPY